MFPGDVPSSPYLAVCSGKNMTTFPSKIMENICNLKGVFGEDFAVIGINFLFFYHQGHPVCEPCKLRPEVRYCPTCRQRIVGRATLVEKIAAQVFSDKGITYICTSTTSTNPCHILAEISGDLWLP